MGLSEHAAGMFNSRIAQSLSIFHFGGCIFFVIIQVEIAPPVCRIGRQIVAEFDLLFPIFG